MKLFAKFRKTEEKSTDKAFMQMVMPSVLGIVLCMICLCSATWAWFGTSMNNESVIQAGSYEATMKVTYVDGESNIKSLDGNILLPGVEYTVEVKAYPSITGYLAVKIGNDVILYSKGPFNTSESGSRTITFTVFIAPELDSRMITVDAFWGVRSDEEIDKLKDEIVLDDGRTYIVFKENGEVSVSNDSTWIALIMEESSEKETSSESSAETVETTDASTADMIETTETIGEMTEEITETTATIETMEVTEITEATETTEATEAIETTETTQATESTENQGSAENTEVQNTEEESTSSVVEIQTT